MINFSRAHLYSQEITWKDEDNSEKNRMHALWSSVITQALIDAASNSKKKN